MGGWGQGDDAFIVTDQNLYHFTSGAYPHLDHTCRAPLYKSRPLLCAMDTEDGGATVCACWRGGGGGAVEGGDDNNNGSWAVLSAKSTVTANLNC